MYQHPATLELMATMHQDELLREARESRLARLAGGANGRHAAADRLVAVALSILVSIALVAFVI